MYSKSKLPAISAELVDWARDAGYEYTGQDHSGAALFLSAPSGEIRFFIRGSSDDGYTLTCSERGQTEQFELCGSTTLVIERHLFAVFGSANRSKRGLLRLVFPAKQEQLATGYAMSPPNANGYRQLRDSRGWQALARGSATSVPLLVRLSHLLESPLADLAASFHAVDGRPVFGVK